MTERKFPRYSDEIRALMDRTDEMITAVDLAPVVRMHPQVIVRYAKEGKWPRDICNYVVSGNRVKFFRKDFLRKAGFIDEDPPETDIYRMILEELKEIRKLLTAGKKEEEP